MPELPDVEVIRRTIDRGALYQPVEGIDGRDVRGAVSGATTIWCPKRV